MTPGADGPAQGQGFQRRTILIKKGLQYRYMALILISVLIGFLIVGLEVSWTLSKILAEYPMMQPSLDHMAGMVPLFLLKLGIYMGIVLIVSGIVSHRMAGPIYKFEKSAQIIASGDLTHRVFLRKGDQLTDLQDELNKMLASMQSRIKEDRNRISQVASRIDEIASKSSDSNLHTELLKLKDQLSGITGGFKI